jgi:hypothetical protein
MPIRRLNYTDRRRIARHDVQLRLVNPPDRPVYFEAHVDLSKYDLPVDGKISIEAYRQTARQRFPWGTVSVPNAPADTSLKEFDSPDAVLFRVRVTDAGVRRGVLLAEADQIRPTLADDDDSSRIPLLPPAGGDLGDEIWRVEIEGRPILRINSKLPNWREAARSDQFRALVFPSAFRQVLQYILLVEGYTDTDDPEAWQSQWLLFATSIPGVPGVPKGSEEQREWIEDAASAFARRTRLRARYEQDFFGVTKSQDRFGNASA